MSSTRSPRLEGVPCKTTLVCQDCNTLFQDGNRIAVFWQPVHGIMDGTFVAIEVADTGPGIPEKSLACGRNCTTGREHAACPTVAWGWRWCAPSPSGTGAR
jgi:hypothetical protein